MPRYFFYIVQDGKEIADHEGNEFSGLDEAKSEAVASAKDVARQDIAESRSLKDACIEKFAMKAARSWLPSTFKKCWTVPASRISGRHAVRRGGDATCIKQAVGFYFRLSAWLQSAGGTKPRSIRHCCA